MLSVIVYIQREEKGASSMRTKGCLVLGGWAAVRKLGGR